MEILDNYESLSFFAGADDWHYTIKLNFEEIDRLANILWFYENEITEPLDEITKRIIAAFAEVKAPING